MLSEQGALKDLIAATRAASGGNPSSGNQLPSPARFDMFDGAVYVLTADAAYPATTDHV